MTVEQMLKCARCSHPVRIDKGLALHVSWADPFSEENPEPTHSVTILDRKVSCAQCAKPVLVRDGRALHDPKAIAVGDEWEPHEVRVTCPRCGVFLDGPEGVEAVSIDFEPYHLAGVAFYADRRCRGVWHRFPMARKERRIVERFFRDHGATSDGERYLHPAEAAKRP